MLKRLLIAALFAPLLAFGQSYPSPTFNNLTVQGTFTATGKVGLSSLATQAANTVVANVTGSTASPTAVAMPSCSATGNALGYTSGTGFTCFTGYAPLASPTFTGTPAAPTAATNTNTTQIATTGFVEGEFANPPAGGFGSTTRRPVLATTISANSTITPSTTAGIVGTTAADNANAGSVGEYVTATGSGVSLTNSTNANITSISLTAGDWEVSGSIAFAASATNLNAYASGASTTTVTLPATGLFLWSNITGQGNEAGAIPPQRFNVSTTTTVFLVATANFTTGTVSATGILRARRVR